MPLATTSSAAALPWRIPLVFAVSFFVHYLDRNIIALAMPAMARDFNWSDKQIGGYGELLLGAFFLTYGLAQMILSAPAERWGTKRSLIAVVLGFSLCTIGIGIASTLTASIALLVVLRAVLGVTESVHVPMMSATTARHFPPDVRARANSTWSVGLIVATALGPVITVPIIAANGWQTAFMVIGALGLVIALPLLVWGLPRDVPAPVKTITATRWHFTHQPNYWLYVACGVFNAFCAFGILGWLPTYFVKAKGMDFNALGWPLAIVFTMGVIGTLLIAALGDRLKRRVLLAAFGFASAAVLCYSAIQATSLIPLVALFAAAVFAQSAFTAQEYATVQALAGDANVGAATGLYNGISLVLGGVGGSLVPGAIVAATGDFNLGLTSVAAGAAVACVLCAVLSIRSKL
jgi:sugar phosphate permease